MKARQTNNTNLLLGNLANRYFGELSGIVDDDDVIGALRDHHDAGLVTEERHLRDLLGDHLPVRCVPAVDASEDLGLSLVAEDLDRGSKSLVVSTLEGHTKYSKLMA